jgi:hypothetical protein
VGQSQDTIRILVTTYRKNVVYLVNIRFRSGGFGSGAEGSQTNDSRPGCPGCLEAGESRVMQEDRGDHREKYFLLLNGIVLADRNQSS